MHLYRNLKILSALMDDFEQISVYFSHSVNSIVGRQISLFYENRIADYTLISAHDNRLIIKVKPLQIKKHYQIGFGRNKYDVFPHGVLDQEQFHYPGHDLGMSYHKTQTTFKVFAPTATRIKLNLFENWDQTEPQAYELSEAEHGVWHVTIEQDILGFYYSFNVDGVLPLFDFTKEVLDPYAPCVIGRTNRAQVIDYEQYPALVSSPIRQQAEEAVIYEVHVRDISIDQSTGCANNGRYLALAEKDTYLNHDPQTEITTLVNHFKDLGVNTIQIMPLQDFDNLESDPHEYGWGYMPRFFNTPDGIYSSDWKSDAKIREVKQLVNSLHEEKFKVILDVVYNHTAEGFYGDGVYSFNAFVPYYYYRFGNGHISNGSGCGNEFRSESFMGRKFIIDSLKFWVSFYGFDGFRFDLMGLIDLETMILIVNELKKIKKDIMLYGEPWTGGLTPINPTYKGMQRDKSFSVFNDDFRDAIKGQVGEKKGKGFVQTFGHFDYDKIIQGILGSINTFTAHPGESLNYIEVHDNHTLFDKLYFSVSERDDFIYPEGELLQRIIQMHELAAFIVLTSQGIPVLHLGQDFLRTKQGIDNSYNLGDDINKINWNQKKEYYEVFQYYKNLIEIRKKQPLFYMHSENKIRQSVEFKYDLFPISKNHGIAYLLENGYNVGNPVDILLILINPYAEEVKVKLPEGEWKKLFFNRNYYRIDHPVIADELSLKPMTGNILFKE